MLTDAASTFPDPRPVLSMAELEAFDPRGGSGPEHGQRWRCPICQNKERTLSVHATTGAYNCKRGSCGVKGLLREFWSSGDGKAAHLGSSRERSRRALLQAFALPTIEEPPKAPNAPQQAAAAQQTARPSFDWRGCYDNAPAINETEAEAGRKYLQARGLRISTATRAGVRFAHYYQGTGPAVLFPICDISGALVAVVARAVNSSDKRSGGPKRDGAFFCEGALDKSLPALIVCEAPIDALSLASCGFPAIALNGCDAPTVLQRAAAYRPVLIATDADEAGDKAAQVLTEDLAACGATCRRLRPEGAKDWNEMLHNTARGGLPDWLRRNAWHLPPNTGPHPAAQAAPDPRALPAEAGALFWRNVKAARRKYGASWPSADIHKAAHVLTLLDLGRDPVTGLACAPAPREELPAESDAGQIYRDHNTMQVLEPGETSEDE